MVNGIAHLVLEAHSVSSIMGSITKGNWHTLSRILLVTSSTGGSSFRMTIRWTGLLFPHGVAMVWKNLLCCVAVKYFDSSHVVAPFCWIGGAVESEARQGNKLMGSATDNTKESDSAVKESDEGVVRWVRWGAVILHLRGHGEWGRYSTSPKMHLQCLALGTLSSVPTSAETELICSFADYRYASSLGTWGCYSTFPINTLKCFIGDVE